MECLHEIEVKKQTGIDVDSTHCNFILHCKKCGKNFRANSLDDGFHTFQELYDHRQMLFCLLMNANSDISWKSMKHEDGSMLDGDWFVAGIRLPTGDITYHLEGRFWDYINTKVLEFAPKWDGHTSSDVIDRMKEYCRLTRS
ncbi:hypothetical protein [Desulfonema limicola]|uniref:WDGH domain-containing protein n=1 Tax=Desulfonema limicola TaxID=45656 RepID=UPI001A9B9422|nr:hypothetical protein [Desulfonema limicola]